MDTLLPKDNLDRNISRLNSNLEKLTSFQRVFFMSIVQGVGGVIGATVIAGVMLFVLSKFIFSIEQIPVVGDWVKYLSQFSNKTTPSPTPYPSVTLTISPTAIPSPNLTPTPIINVMEKL